MTKIKDADSARRALEAGRVIVETRQSEGASYGLDNGQPVTAKIVKQLQGDLFVAPSEDGLFPGHSQTYRVIA
jgi:hypothetical protein